LGQTLIVRDAREDLVMPRFFFHFVHDGERLTDPVGRELPDLQLAHGHAMLLTTQATCLLQDAADGRKWLIKITDASG
jgi:hypothetical protein